MIEAGWRNDLLGLTAKGSDVRAFPASLLNDHICVPGTLVVHVDGTAFCTEASCEANSTGDSKRGASAHMRVMVCSVYFDICPLCTDHS
jgi:hypothetical protein